MMMNRTESPPPQPYFANSNTTIPFVSTSPIAFNNNTFNANNNTYNVNNNNNNINININNNNNDIVLMNLRMSVKDIQRSAACTQCRSMKRKCDGKDPCSSCVAKNRTCTYAQRKQRGPIKKYSVITHSSPETEAQKQVVVASPSNVDTEMANKMEALTLGNIYLKYINAMVPMTSDGKLNSPQTVAQKVQSYAALAFTARICGNAKRANSYISQARALSGEIYDSPDHDSIAAMCIMANYYSLIVNNTQSSHYTRMASSLRSLLPKESPLEYRVNMVVDLTSIMSDVRTSNKKKAKLLKHAGSNVLTAHADEKAENLALMSGIYNVSSHIIGFLEFNSNLLHIENCAQFYNLFDKVVIDDNTRLILVNEVNKVTVACTLLGAPEFYTQLHILCTIYAPLFIAIAEWRSGHLEAALAFTTTVLQGILSLEKADSIGYACGVLDFPQMAMLGGLAKFLLDIGQNNLARQLNDKIRTICKMLTPELDFVLAFVDEFDTWIPSEDRPAVEDVTNISIPSIPSPSNMSPSNISPNNITYSPNTNVPTSTYTNNSPNYNFNSINSSPAQSPLYTSVNNSPINTSPINTHNSNDMLPTNDQINNISDYITLTDIHDFLMAPQ